MKFKWPWVRRSERDSAIESIRHLAFDLLRLIEVCERGEQLFARKDADLQASMRLVHQQQAQLAELRHVAATVAEISKREVSRIYQQPKNLGLRDHFEIRIRFTPELMRGFSTDSLSMGYLARHIALQVEHEIARGKFLQRDPEYPDVPRFRPFEELPR